MTNITNAIKLNKDKITLATLIFFGTAAVMSISLLHNNLHDTYEYMIFFPLYIILGYKVFLNAIDDLCRGHFLRESFLMTIATLGAVFLHQLPEALAVLLFYRAGIYFEELGEEKSKNAVKEIMKTKADFANKVIDGKVQKIDVQQIEVGDRIVIYPSEKVPVDCIIDEGKTSVDTRTLTGESMPRYVEAKDSILATMINIDSVIYATVTKKLSESSISRILYLIEEASSKKTRIEKFISRFASVYTPIVVLSAILLTLIPTLVYGTAVFREWLSRSLTLLVISCPCAFIVGIPLSYFSAIGRFAKEGIVFKGVSYIDIAAKIKNIIFDKTGTLTTGIFSVTKTVAFGMDEKTLLHYAAYAEYSSRHPIAKSITEYAVSRGEIIDIKKIQEHKDIHGRGVYAVIDGRKILAGTAKLMEENGVSITGDKEATVHIAVDGKYAGFILIGDSIKEYTKDTIKILHKEGIKTAILSGDKKSIVDDFAKDIGTDIAKSELLPNEKLFELEKIMATGITAYVGDGVNDAPSLARADIAVAMGGVTTDSAVESSDVIIMDDNPKKIPSIVSVAKKAKGIVRQNIIFAFAVKGIFLTLGAFGLSSMWMAVFADTGVTVIVIFNALRMLYFKNKTAQA